MDARIRVHDYSKWVCKRSKHAHVPSLPSRGLLLGPSGSGKTIIMVSMILDLYRGCWARVIIMSPSIHLDSAWGPVKDYIRDVLKVPDSEKVYYDDWDPEAIQRILAEQTEITKKCKEHGKHCHGILIIADDLADDERMHTAGRGNILN